MVRMKKQGLNNFGLKIVSIVVAIIIWIVVANVDDYKTTKQISGIEIEFINGSAITEKNKVYEVPKGTTVDIVVKGKRSVVEELTSEDFKAVADLSKMSVTNAVTVEVSAVSSAIGKELTITYTDNAVVVAVEDKLETQFPITVRTTSEVAEGYAISSKTATPNLITVTGAESVVNNIREVVVSVDVRGASENISAIAQPIFIDGNGEEIDSAKFEYDVKEVEVLVEIMKTKELSVKVSQIGKPRDGYAIASVDYQPTSIIVVGSPVDLAKIEEVVIDDLDVENCYKDIETSVNIADYLPAGVTLVDANPEVAIKIVIEKVEERELRVEPNDIILIGKNTNYNYVFKGPITYSLSVRGLKADIDELTIQSLSPSIDVSGKGPGTYTFTVTFKDAKGVEVLDAMTVEVEIQR